MGLFAFLKPRQISAWPELQHDLDAAQAFTATEFGECSKAEQLAMLQMRRMELFRQAARNRTQNDARRLALFMTAHAWWIIGLVLQRDRKSEVTAAVSRGAWDATNVCAIDAAGVLQWASSLGAFKTEQQAEQFAVELWERLALPEAERPRAIR